ncbi:cysteine synthase family protein [Streptomyces sp. ICN441]|uniref:O-acetylserine sulfhydrylase n=1 Tax=Streptomyces tirandamycinicus TaxID=2174846 RepID=A0A2S1T2N5_9ACTN|nr:MULTISPECIES: cysteine synthase family protein [Streptomyces]AWI32777.1 cysteine synthase family protein [Streptomyces tirandamycinicus]MCY0983639.1 cysteine synthase family protein [Streptomyces tirandamycinicus]TFE42850.1 cysteine synthase family protein [Streptomyces sp. ICN441]
MTTDLLTAPAGRHIAAGLEELIGNTPLVRLAVPDAAPGTEVLAKIESANPFASSKDRAALAMLDGAEQRGELAPGGTVVESTSGNTGIALAALSAVRGYRCVVVLPDSATPERIGLLTALGAEIVQTPSEEGFAGAIAKAEEVQAAIPGSWYVRQHENPDNVRAHYETTGPEIWADSGGRVDVLVAGVGTGGTLTGAGRFLRERNPGVEIVAVEPEGSPVLSRGYAGSHRIPGLNGGFVSPTTDVSLIDRVLTCSDEAALATARALTRQQALFAGLSSGAAVHAAALLARDPQYAGRTIVTVLPDTGERYVSIWNERTAI